MRLDLIPHDVIRTGILPLLPACEILRFRVLGRHWNDAYLKGIDAAKPLRLRRTQPANGGCATVGFLLEDDEMQYRATEGLQIQNQRYFVRLDQAFAGRNPRIVATSRGFHLVYLTGPLGFDIWNPMINERRHVPDPQLGLGHGANDPPVQFGLHIHTEDGRDRCTSYTCIALYVLRDEIHFGTHNQTVSIKVFRSTAAVWIDLGFELELINDMPIPLLQANPFRPGAVINAGGAVHFHLSRTRLVCYQANVPGDGFALPFNVPAEIGFADPVLVSWKNEAALMHLDEGGSVLIHVLNWIGDFIPAVEVSLVPVVERCRSAFLSIGYNLRTRFIGEQADAALAGAKLVGYVSPGWYLIYQRNGYVRFQMVEDKDVFKAARVDLGPERPHLPFFNCDSSFLRFMKIDQ